MHVKFTISTAQTSVLDKSLLNVTFLGSSANGREHHVSKLTVKSDLASKKDEMVANDDQCSKQWATSRGGGELGALIFPWEWAREKKNRKNCAYTAR